MLQEFRKKMFSAVCKNIVKGALTAGILGASLNPALAMNNNYTRQDPNSILDQVSQQNLNTPVQSAQKNLNNIFLQSRQINQSQPIPTIDPLQPTTTVSQSQPIPTVAPLRPTPTVSQSQQIPIPLSQPIPTVSQSQPTPTAQIPIPPLLQIYTIDKSQSINTPNQTKSKKRTVCLNPENDEYVEILNPVDEYMKNNKNQVDQNNTQFAPPLPPPPPLLEEDSNGNISLLPLKYYTNNFNYQTEDFYQNLTNNPIELNNFINKRNKEIKNFNNILKINNDTITYIYTTFNEYLHRYQNSILEIKEQIVELENENRLLKSNKELEEKNIKNLNDKVEFLCKENERLKIDLHKSLMTNEETNKNAAILLEEINGLKLELQKEKEKNKGMNATLEQKSYNIKRTEDYLVKEYTKLQKDKINTERELNLKIIEQQKIIDQLQTKIMETTPLNRKSIQNKNTTTTHEYSTKPSKKPIVRSEQKRNKSNNPMTVRNNLKIKK